MADAPLSVELRDGVAVLIHRPRRTTSTRRCGPPRTARRGSRRACSAASRCSTTAEAPWRGRLPADPYSPQEVPCTDPRHSRARSPLITGAARGQGRSHAVHLAAAGADVIALDICRQIETVGYEMSTPGDLAETVTQVEAMDRRIVAAQADVRDAAALRSAVDEAAEQLGGIDIVIANAGIAPGGGARDRQEQMFRDLIEVNLFGVWNTVHAAAPRMIEHGRDGSVGARQLHRGHHRPGRAIR